MPSNRHTVTVDQAVSVCVQDDVDDEASGFAEVLGKHTGKPHSTSTYGSFLLNMSLLDIVYKCFVFFVWRTATS